MPADMNGYFKKQGGPSGGQNRPGGSPTPDFMKNFGKKAGFIYVIIGLVILLLIARPFAIVNSGEVGIQVTLGKYEDQPLMPGFHVIIPFVQKVIIVDTRMRILNYNKTEMVADRQGINQRPPISVLDERGLPVEIELTVQYRLKPTIAPQTIASLGLNWEEKTINPAARDVVRSVIGSFTAEELPVNRNVIAGQIDAGMKDQVSKLENQPIEIIDVQLRGIQLPPKIKDQIEQVQIARQEAERAKNQVERAKQEALRRAEESRGIAEAKRIEAQGIADKVTIEAAAQAQANQIIAKSLTSQLLTLEQIKVQGKFNEALQENKDARIFLTPGGAVPSIWVDAKDKQRSSSVSGN